MGIPRRREVTQPLSGICSCNSGSLVRQAQPAVRVKTWCCTQEIKLLPYYTFLSLTLIVLAGYLGECWSQFQLRADTGRVTPLAEPYLNIWMLATLLKGTSPRVLVPLLPAKSPSNVCPQPGLEPGTPDGLSYLNIPASVFMPSENLHLAISKQ